MIENINFWNNDISNIPQGPIINIETTYPYMSPTLPPPPPLLHQEKSNNFFTNNNKKNEIDVTTTVTVKNIMYKNITGRNAM